MSYEDNLIDTTANIIHIVVVMGYFVHIYCQF